MQALASGDPEVSERWNDLNFGMRKMMETLAPHTRLSPLDFKRIVAQPEVDKVLDQYQALISYHPYGILHRDGEPFYDGGRPRHWDNANFFLEEVAPGPPLSTERFLHQRFQTLDDWFRQCQFMRGRVDATGFSGHIQIDNYHRRDPAHDGGLFDALQSLPPGDLGFTMTTERLAVWTDSVAAVQAFDYDRLGNANFKGLIYTNGAFVGRDDVTVLGTVIVNGDHEVGDLVVDGVTYHPGEVGLFGHSRLTRVDEFFDDGVHVLVGAGTLDVKRWINR